MFLLQLIEALRKVLQGSGVPEILPFPAPLAEPWCHPDIFLAMTGNGVEKCFVLQNVALRQTFLSDSATHGPDMIWVSGAGRNVPDEQIFMILAAIKNELLPENESAAFSFAADSRRKFCCSETGATWKILFCGVECGRLFIYSSLPGCCLADKPATVVSLNLRKLSRLVSEHLTESPAWAENVPFSSLLANHAWTPPAKNCDAGIAREDLLQDLPGDSSDQEKFCRLLGAYNHYCWLIAGDHDLQAECNRRLQKLLETMQRSALKPVADISRSGASDAL